MQVCIAPFVGIVVACNEGWCLALSSYENCHVDSLNWTIDIQE
jgi:hypothetical protein